MGDFPILNISEIPLDEEINKLNEEVEEIIEAINNLDEENIIEEFYDVIQVMVNILNKLQLIDELNNGLDKHIKKIQKRNWDIVDYI